MVSFREPVPRIELERYSDIAPSDTADDTHLVVQKFDTLDGVDQLRLVFLNSPVNLCVKVSVSHQRYNLRTSRLGPHKQSVGFREHTGHFIGVPGCSKSVM